MSNIDQLKDELRRIQSLPINTDEDAVRIAKSAFNLYFFAKDIKTAVGADYDFVMNGARQIISDIMVYSQSDSVRTMDGAAYIPKIGYTVKYDADGLDKLCEENEELRAILSPYRQSRPTTPGLTLVRGK